MKLGMTRTGNQREIKVGMTKKPKPTPDLQEAVDSGKSNVSLLTQKKRENEKKILDRLDMAFYFSVVFATRKERDAWLEEHGLRLRDDDFLYASDIEAKMKAIAKPNRG